ncbi:MAG: hypothetical protein U9R36_06015 [Elusimicrobiota bacterium]|nr:hypothetical protein [Elusimicrobiota bacterium]
MKDDIFKKILNNTVILKMPERNISTFGTTNISYHLLSKKDNHTKIRDGRVISYRPEIVISGDIEELFEGFGEAPGEYARQLYEIIDSNPKILNYKFKNIPGSAEEAARPFVEVYKSLKEKIEKSGDNLSAIIKTPDDKWEIPVMKFILDMTVKSADSNIREMDEHGMFPDEAGVPENVRNKIEYLFQEAEKDSSRSKELGSFLNKHGLFEQYEERFFKLF